MLQQAMSLPEWSSSVHTNAVDLSSQTSAFLSQLPRKHAPKRFKRHLHEPTWNLIGFKKTLFQQINQARRSMRQHCIRMHLRKWRHKQFVPHDLIEDKQFRRHIAWLEWWMSIFSNRVKSAIRRDDKEYFTDLAKKASQAFSIEGLQGLWRQLRSVLPKHVKQRLTAKFDIDEALQNHFEQLEADTTLPAHALCEAHRARKFSEWQQRPPTAHLHLHDLPTRYEIEIFSRKQKPNKACGPDDVPPEIAAHGAAAISESLHNLAMKCFLSETEPILYKGGRIAALFKGKGTAEVASNYRGILISPVYGKILHAWSRHRVLPTLQARMTPGQMGGRAGQQTATAAHSIRLRIQMAKHFHISTAVIFVDIKAAFHSMIRQFIFQGRSVPDVAFPDREDLENDFALDAILDELRHRYLYPPDDLPEGLRQWLAELHRETWFWMPSTHGSFGHGQLTHTQQGTRPGSPMADAGFNLLAAEVAQRINHKLQQCEAYQAGMAQLPVCTPPIMWVDDLALPLASTNAESLPQLSMPFRFCMVCLPNLPFR